VAVISYQPNKPQNRLFANKKRTPSGVVWGLAFSFILMIADEHYHSVDIVRSGLSLLVAPIQYLVDYPVRLVGNVHALLGSKKSLVDENITLRSQQILLEAQLQKLRVINNENSQLRELLSASPSKALRTVAAQILAVDTTNSRQLLVINKGKRDGVFTGQPVLDAKGVMGQVIDVGLMTSTVLLISDSKSAVPVRDDRTGERAILVGMNNMSQLSLINLPRTSLIVKGDLLVTSGLGRRYPEGYPVARVEEVKAIPGDDFIRVIASPIALLNRTRLVLVVWPEEEHDAITLQINERVSVMEGKS
jgi:rod shape-determining protein MreC